MSQRTKMKAAKQCIFCGGGKLSKEHFWSAWMAEYLPRYPDGRRVEHYITFTKKFKLSRPPEAQTRPGQTWTKKLRVVCKKCNNGWMSVLENEAKPILLSLMASKPHILDVPVLQLLSRWIAMKVMVVEFSKQNGAVSRREERRRFMQSQEIPENFRIWISQCGQGGWESSFLRHAATLTPAGMVPENEFNNVQTVAFGVGDLFIYVLHTTLAGVMQRLAFSDNMGVTAIHPVPSQTSWPPLRRLTVEQASSLANSLEHVIEEPRVSWMPRPPRVPTEPKESV